MGDKAIIENILLCRIHGMIRYESTICPNIKGNLEKMGNVFPKDRLEITLPDPKVVEQAKADLEYWLTVKNEFCGTPQEFFKLLADKY